MKPLLVAFKNPVYRVLIFAELQKVFFGKKNRGLGSELLAGGVEAEEDEEEECEAPEGGAAVAEEGERNADYGA